MRNDKNALTDLANQSNHTDQSDHKVLPELEKSKVHIIVEIIEYVPNAVVSKTIIKKTTGNVTMSVFAAGEELAEKTIAFDTFIQIIDGAAEVRIDDEMYKLKLVKG